MCAASQHARSSVAVMRHSRTSAMLGSKALVGGEKLMNYPGWEFLEVKSRRNKRGLEQGAEEEL
eukprot:879162-Rhodomonas_salina.1